MLEILMLINEFFEIFEFQVSLIEYSCFTGVLKTGRTFKLAYI